MKTFVGLVVVALLGGCAYPAYYDAYPQQPYQAAPPPVQYAPPQVQYPAPQGCMPGYVMVPWFGCVWPMYGPMYGGYYYYGDPPFRFNFNFNFGKGGGKHHGGGRHHRR